MRIPKTRNPGAFLIGESGYVLGRQNFSRTTPVETIEMLSIAEIFCSDSHGALVNKI